MSAALSPAVVEQIVAILRLVSHPNAKPENVTILQAFGEQCARLALQAHGWQPIKSAPIGEWLLLAKAGTGRAAVAMLPENDWTEHLWTGSRYEPNDATHWMPLPAPPEPSR